MIDPTVTHIKIPMPRQTQNIYRGYAKEHAPISTPISIRWTQSDRDLIMRQAHMLGVSFSEFVRWCAYYAADEIHRINVATTYKAAVAAERRARINPDEYSDETQ